MSKYKLLFCLFTFVFPLIGCRPAQVVVPSVQATSPKTYNSEIPQDDLDKLSFAFCSEGNCPCGDGYCSQGSYCINDMCFCGAHPDEGYFDQETIASNNYGEFKCVTYKVGCFDNSTTNFPPDLIKYAKRILKYHEICSNVRNGKVVLHDFICARKNGCKTGDGRKYSKLKDIPESLNETGTMEFNSPWCYGNFREGNDRKTPVDDIALSSDYYFSSQNMVFN